ncbi:peptidoglycan-binding domain-containing protein [Paracoccus everestensis]|uniref:peptidoglycan-binding domain-containing protein n=1 Tax=Paracoccus everestensis TaxID=2903900 RepID=UPI001F4334BD|nr:peptidoglycan-binding domain-containing protein [Paracoccus everestensis]
MISHTDSWPSTLEDSNRCGEQSAQAEAQLGLTQAARAAIQRRLAARGYYIARIDAVFGAGTRRAIRVCRGSRPTRTRLDRFPDSPR